MSNNKISQQQQKDELQQQQTTSKSVGGGSSESSSSESNDNSNADSDKESEGEEESRNTSTSSSSDEFYDAEEPTGTLLRFTRKILDNPKDRVDLTTLTKAEVDSSLSGSSDLFGSGLVTSSTPESSSSRYLTTTSDTDPVPAAASSSNSFLMNSSSLSATSILSRSEMEEEMEEEKRRKRLEEMRRRLNTDEIEETQGDEGTSPSDSQTSSVEGLYGATSGKTSHPFKVVDHDTISMQSGVSVGRLGRISANNTVPFPSAMNSNNYTFQQQQQLTHPYGQGHAQSQSQQPSTFSTSTTVNLSPSTTSKPQQQSTSVLQSSLGSNNHNNNHYYNQQLHNHFLHSSSTTASSSSSVSSSEQVPSVSSTATTTIPAAFSATEGNSPISETSSNCSSSIFNVPGATAVSDTRSPNNAPEPDLVTSCTSSSHGSVANNNQARNESPGSGIAAPVAPPRRKRKGLLGKTLSEDGGGGSLQDFPISSFSKEFNAPPQAQSLPRRPATAKFDSGSGTSSLPSPNPPSPTVSIRSVCRELDKALADTTSHNKIFVVKAQDEEKTRAKSSGPKVLKRTESLPKDATAAFDPSGTGSGGYRDSSSGSSTLTSTTTTTATSSMNPSGEVDSIPSPSPKPAIQEKTLTTTHAPEQSFSFGRSSTGTGRSNSAPKSGSNQLASIISAMAIEGEKRDLELEKEKAQFNLMIRTRTDSGKLLSDLEILEQVQVLNLDTGERVPLSIAEDKIPQCINPLSLHIMRLTSEYVGGENGPKDRDSDEESLDSKKSSAASQEDGESSSVRRKTAQVKRFLGSTVRKTVDKAKSLAQRKHPKEDVEISTNEGVQLGSGMDSLVKMKASHSHKGPYDFDQLQQVQDLFGEHCGPVWCMKFSNCGRLLATAGQDKIIRIWVLKDHLPYFQDMRTKNTSDKVSPTPSQESIVSQHSHHSAEEMLQACEMSDPRSPFVPRPLCVYSGHTADLLDIAWSKSFFLLSSSMDRTVRLWHISRRECLCCFQHIDFVTAIAFHPRDDRYFLSGSLDGKLRLWNIPDKKVALWNEVNGPNNLITAANFCQNGKFAVVGTYDGRCIFYHTEQLKYHTQIIVHKRKRLAGRKITGIEPMPGEDKILVTSNDSRIRMYDLRDLSLTCKYKGFTNSSSQIKGTFSHDGKYVVSGSENQCVYIWKTNHDYSKFSSARKDRNGYWEGVKAHNAVVTCAVFAPDPDLIVKQIDKRDEKQTEDDKNQRVGMVKSPSLTKSKNQPYHQQSQSHSSSCPAGYVLVSADFSGCIKVFFSRVKPKHSSLPASALV